MPCIHLEIGKLTPEQKREVATSLTDAAAKATGAPREAFYVFIDEYEHENVAVGGTLLSDRPAR